MASPLIQQQRSEPTPNGARVLGQGPSGSLRAPVSGAWTGDASGSTLRFRDASGSEEPVRLVVFDFDETLTVATFAPQPGCEPQYCIDLSFKSPWVEDRLNKLKRMLSALRQGRKLTVLTRNPGGVRNVTDMLDRAGLSEYFVAVWCMPLDKHQSAYRENGQWRIFKPPVEWCPSGQKPDMLRHLADHTRQWLPQVGPDFQLKLDNIVLVDDDEKNFESTDTGVRVVRGCKVANHQGSLSHNMEAMELGGLGARSEQDFAGLQRFIDAPWGRGAVTPGR